MERAGEGAVGHPYKVVGYINPANMVERVETWLENPIFGDMLVESIYTEYREAANGVKYPGVHRAEPRRLADLRGADPRRERQPGQHPAAGDASASAGRPRRRAWRSWWSRRARRAGPTSEKLADGVYPHQRRLQRARRRVRRPHLAVRAGPAERGARAGDHRRDEEGHSEQADPLRRDLASPLRSHERTARGRRRRHHHRHAPDQRGVLRARLAAPRTLAPDAMSKSGKKPKIEGIAGDKRVFQDATRTFEVHLIKGLPHADGMLIVVSAEGEDPRLRRHVQPADRRPPRCPIRRSPARWCSSTTSSG